MIDTASGRRHKHDLTRPVLAPCQHLVCHSCVRQPEYFTHASLQLAALNEVSKLSKSRRRHGDKDEFPVGPGQALADIIASGVVPVVRLTEVFRQAAQGDRLTQTKDPVRARFCQFLSQSLIGPKDRSISARSSSQ